MNHSEQILRREEIEASYIKKPVIPGIECVGEVIDGGNTCFENGDRVVALMGGMGRSFDGSYAEYALLPEHHVFKVDTALSWEELGAVPETYFTAWGSLFECLHLMPEDTLLIRGATCALGYAAMQLAKSLGCRIIATTHRESKLQLLIAADEAVVDDGTLIGKISGVTKALELVGPRTLRDTLKAVEKGTIVCSTGIMSSYNMVNGTYVNEHRHLLQEILRDEWGFDGYLVTDWGADNDHTEGVRNGCNLVMPAPGPDCAIGLVKDVEAGKITEAELDVRVAELLKVVFERTEAVAKAPKSFDADAHHAIARKCAEGSIVLLDNDGILPLASNASVAVIGDFAETPRYQGAGSSQVNPTKLDNFLDCAKAAGLNITGFAKGFSRTDPAPQTALIDEAVKLADGAETVLLFIGLDEILESEGMDRLHMELSKGQQALIDAVAKVNKNIILVISGGSPFVMPERSIYRAAIHGYLGGQAGAGAMVDAIIGKVNPSGKLNETWPHVLADNPSYPYFPSKERTAEYREGLYIGYRYYDTAGVPVRYPFGYGLSYTTFEYSNISANKDEVTFTITNTGKADGAEVAQVYVSCVDGKIFRPRKELKGFAKVFLKAGESKTVTVKLDDKAFRYFNVATDKWEVETANYEISVAASVSDVKLTATVHIDGTNAPNPYESMPAYESGRIMNIADAEFEQLLGHKIPDGKWGGTLTANDAICQLYYAKSWLGRVIYKILTSLKDKAEAKGKPDLNIMFIYNMPFRAIGKMAGGMVSDAMVEDILLIVNGHFFRGVGRVIVDFFKNMSANKAFTKKLEG